MYKKALIIGICVILSCVFCTVLSLVAFIFSARNSIYATPTSYKARISYTLNLDDTYIDENITNLKADKDMVFFLEDGFLWYKVKNPNEYSEKLLNNGFREKSSLNQKFEKVSCEEIVSKDSRFTKTYSSNDICLKGTNFPIVNYIYINIDNKKVEQRYFQIRD